MLYQIMIIYELLKNVNILIDMEADTWVKLLVQESLVPQPGFATGEPDVLSPGIQKELQGLFFLYF